MLSAVSMTQDRSCLRNIQGINDAALFDGDEMIGPFEQEWLNAISL
jgi:hypothetical protein